MACMGMMRGENAEHRHHSNEDGHDRHDQTHTSAAQYCLQHVLIIYILQWIPTFNSKQDTALLGEE